MCVFMCEYVCLCVCVCACLIGTSAQWAVSIAQCIGPHDSSLQCIIVSLPLHRAGTQLVI